MQNSSKKTANSPYSEKEILGKLNSQAGKQLVELLQRNPARMANVLSTWQSGDLKKLQEQLAPILSAQEAEAFRKELMQHE